LSTLVARSDAWLDGCCSALLPMLPCGCLVELCAAEIQPRRERI
jgi:hypothetical protein